MTMARYQTGSLTLKKRAKGPDQWEFRWWATDEAGNRVQRSTLIGNLEQYATKSEAQRAADGLRLEINADLPHAVPVTVAVLVDRYLGDSFEMGRLAFSTQKSYKTYLNGYVKKKWGEHQLQQVRTMAVEQWLRDLALAPRSKVHLRNTMHVLFECAARWELLKMNPITRVRQGGTRRSDPIVLTAAEFRALLNQIKDARVRAMVVLAGCLGLSRSEITGLKWSDFDFSAAVLSVRRGVVQNHVGDTKTQARRKPVPLAPEVMWVLQEWRSTAYAADTDWLFASEQKDGRDPVWLDSVLKRDVQPAAVRAKIAKQVGWHCFRHSFSTLLRAHGVDIKVQQELLRHSTVEMTLNTYTQAISEQKRQAHELIVSELLVAAKQAASAQAEQGARRRAPCRSCVSRL